jgi:hypothetical protein
MKGIKALLLAIAAAVLTFVGTAHAQLSFRSSSSAFTSSGPSIPALRAAAAGGAPMTIVGQSRAPASDDAVTTATSASIVPPSGMQANDLVLVFISAMVPSTTPISYTSNPMAGQTWNLGTTVQNGSNPSTKVYASVFNGTWSGNPSFTWGSTAVAYQMWMVVLRGQDLLGTNYLDSNCCNSATETKGTFAAPASPFDVTIPAASFTTITDNDMVFAVWSSADDNTWSLQTGGWTQPGGQPQWRTMAAAGGAGADSSSSIAYMSQATAGAIPAVTNRQASLGGDAGNWRIFAIRPNGVRKPAGTVAGDVMIASIAFGLDTPTITPPTGWTLIRRITSSSKTTGFDSMAIYYRVADASDASVSSYYFTISGGASNSWVGAIQSFSGVDTSNPIDVESGQVTGVGLTHATPSVTTTGTNRLIVTTHAVYAGNLTWTPPAGMTETLDFKGGKVSPGWSVETNYVLQAAAGATGIKTATASGPSPTYGGLTHILALRPAASGGSSNTLTINKPAGVVQNDVMIASISVGPNTITITPPSGWALVRRTDNANGTSNSLAVYSKVAGAGEGASYDWTFSSGNTGAAGGIMAFSGADPVLETDSGVNTGSGTSSATNAVNTAFANTMIITSHAIGSASTWTPPAGMTETVDANGGSASLEMNYVLQSAAGGSGTKSATASVAGYGNAHIIALRRVLGAFNAFETTTAAGSTSGFIKTKVAGSTVSMDIAALSAAKTAVAPYYVGTMRIEVLDSHDDSGTLDANGCRSTWTVLQTLSPDTTFSASNNGRKTISFTQANSYPNARIRMTSPAGAPDTIACSSDNFAIRPYQFTSILFADGGNANNAGTSRTLNNLTVAPPNDTVHKAGRPFSVRATAVNADGTTVATNYTGTPTATITNCVGSNACVAAPAGTMTIGGSFVAGQLSSDVATYNNVGALAVTLVDSTFAAVDSADGSTATEMNITSSPVNVGRFVPHHFAVAYNTPVFGTACGGFTYVGQPFSYTTAPVITVTAQSFDNVTTTNYTGALWQITNSSLTGKSYTTASGGSLDITGITASDPLIVDGGNGIGTLTFSSGTGLLFPRSTAVAPFNAEVSLAINVIDADGITYIGNPATFGQASAGNGIAFSSSKEMRFGRLAFRNANGSQLVPLPMRVEAQYAVYTNPPTNTQLGFMTNTADSCTSIANTDVQMSNFTANLSACATAISGAGTLSSGRKTLLLLAPGNLNNGSVLLTANLGVASGTTCTSVGVGGTVSATAANRSYLQGNWASSSSYTSDPSARATFGTVKGADEVIYMRENF